MEHNLLILLGLISLTAISYFTGRLRQFARHEKITESVLQTLLDQKIIHMIKNKETGDFEIFSGTHFYNKGD